MAGASRSVPQPDALRDELPGRDRAFRQTVLNIYDYTCAACGLRVKLSDGFSLVEAAHLIPWEEACNDKPDNGPALCPNHHRAMDRHLITPCPHSEHRAGIWRISRRLDARIAGHRDLAGLKDLPVIAPSEEKFYPAEEGLRWREEHLVTTF